MLEEIEIEKCAEKREREREREILVRLDEPYQVMVRPRGVEEAEVAVLFAVDGEGNGASTHGWNRHCSPLKPARRPRWVIPT